MGKGAYMFVYNLDANDQLVNGVTSQNCMYDNGDDGSNISLWNNQTISPKTSVPSNGWKNPQYIEARGSGLCAFEQSSFTLGFANGGSVTLNLQTDIIAVTESSSGNVVCSVNSNSSLDIWSGQAGIGIMMLPDPSAIPNQQSYIPPQTSNWMDWLNTKTSGAFFTQPLNMVSFPASHDSGMGVISQCTSLAGPTQTQTQTLDIAGQLNAGIRYFDMRPCVWDINNSNEPSDFYFGHFTSEASGQGCLGQQLTEALQQVVSFIQSNNNEIVILKFSHYVDSKYKAFPLSLQQMLVATVQSMLGNLMYTSSQGTKINSISLNSFIQSSQRVICVFDDLDSSLYSSQNGILMFGDLSSNSVNFKAVSQPLLNAILNRYQAPKNWTGNPLALFLNGWRTAEQIEQMTADDIRNTLIVELNLCSVNSIPSLQSLSDDDLSAAAVTYYLLKQGGVRTAADLRTMLLDDQRNTLIVTINSITGTAINSLQALTTGQLLDVLFVSTLTSNLDIYDSYSDSDNLSIMVADQIDKYNNFINGNGNNYQKNGMFLLSYTLTQTTTDAILSALGLGSVLALANYADNYLWTVVTSIYKGPTNQQPPNFVYVDAVNNINAVSAAIYFNLQNGIY